MIAALIIVFREVIEAGLVVGIVLAATRGVPRRSTYVACGIAGGVVGACLVALFGGAIAGLAAGMGQELLNATILGAAVLMLGWHNVWMARHGRDIAREMKHTGEAVASGKRTLAALAVVVGAAVLREGSEVVLFLYGIAASGGTTAVGMLSGGALGVALGAVVSAMMYYGLLRIPTRHVFAVTSALIALLAAGMAAQMVLFLQQAGMLNVWTFTVWDSSRILPESSLLGRGLHALIGYADRPNGLQAAVYLATLAVIVGLMRVCAPHKPVKPRLVAGNAG